LFLKEQRCPFLYGDEFPRKKGKDGYLQILKKSGLIPAIEKAWLRETIFDLEGTPGVLSNFFPFGKILGAGPKGPGAGG
jgi:hypothetical protein